MSIFLSYVALLSNSSILRKEKKMETIQYINFKPPLCYDQSIKKPGRRLHTAHVSSELTHRCSSFHSP